MVSFVVRSNQGTLWYMSSPMMSTSYYTPWYTHPVLCFLCICLWLLTLCDTVHTGKTCASVPCARETDPGCVQLLPVSTSMYQTTPVLLLWHSCQWKCFHKVMSWVKYAHNSQGLTGFKLQASGTVVCGCIICHWVLYATGFLIITAVYGAPSCHGWVREQYIQSQLEKTPSLCLKFSSGWLLCFECGECHPSHIFWSRPM